MENLSNHTAGIAETYIQRYSNLVSEALAQVRWIVKAQQGRITLFASPDTWDEDNSRIKEEVIDNSVALIIDRGAGNSTMYPIDFFDNNGYISVLLVDEYGDYPRIYADEMDDTTVCQLADFLVKTFGMNNKVSVQPTTARYIVLETHGGPEYTIVCMDESGNNLVFETREEAETEAADCQDGIVVEI
jgi:hypothetical protein